MFHVPGQINGLVLFQVFPINQQGFIRQESTIALVAWEGVGKVWPTLRLRDAHLEDYLYDNIFILLQGFFINNLVEIDSSHIFVLFILRSLVPYSSFTSAPLPMETFSHWKTFISKIAYIYI